MLKKLLPIALSAALCLPAFADEAGAAEFAGRRGGRVLTFEAVTPAILKSLAVERGAGLHEHAHAS